MKADISLLDLQNIPRHVAFIMDGNGRWAKSRGLPRVAGHVAGVHEVDAACAAGGSEGLQDAGGVVAGGGHAAMTFRGLPRRSVRGVGLGGRAAYRAAICAPVSHAVDCAAPVQRRLMVATRTPTLSASWVCVQP